MKLSKPQNKTEIELILADFKNQQEALKEAKKNIDELKAYILENVEPGQYGEMLLGIEKRSVKEYVVKARIDTIIKVLRTGDES